MRWPAIMGAMTEAQSIHQEQQQQDVQEIFEVLRRWHPDRSPFELWTEALTLHRVRFETEVLPPRDARQ